MAPAILHEAPSRYVRLSHTRVDPEHAGGRAAQRAGTGEVRYSLGRAAKSKRTRITRIYYI